MSISKLEELKVTDVELDKLMAPFVDYDEDSGTLYFSEKPDWETRKMVNQQDLYLKQMADFINSLLDEAYEQGYKKGGDDMDAIRPSQ